MTDVIRHVPVVLLVVVACTKGPSEAELSQAEAEGHYLAATAAASKNDAETARHELDLVRALNPADPRLPAAEGELWLAQGKVNEATAAFEAAARADGRRANTWARLASLYLAKNDRLRALDAANRALGLNPASFEALDARAQTALSGREVDAAVKDWVAAANAAPEPAKTALLHRAAAALTDANHPSALVELLEAVRAHDGSLSADLQAEYGQALIGVGRLDDAVTVLSDAARRRPGDPTLWELVGELELKRGHLAEATSAFEASLAVKDRPVVHVALGRACHQAHDAGCAQRELAAALTKANGQDARELFDLADLLVAVGRPRDALTLLLPLSDELEQRANQELQAKVAALLQEVKPADTKALARVCSRAPAGACPKRR